MIVYVYRLIDSGDGYRLMTAQVNAEERKQSYRLGDADPKRGLVCGAKILHKRDELLVCGDSIEKMYVFSKEDKPEVACVAFKETLCRTKKKIDARSQWLQEQIDCVAEHIPKEKPVSSSYERFARLLSERNMRAAHVCKATGIASATLTEWKKGTYTPKINKLMLIAEYFNVPVDYFIGDDLQEKQA